MKRIIILIILFSTFNTAFAQKIIRGFSLPESINSDGKSFFVTNIGVKPDVLAKDGDGFISKFTSDGKIIERKFLPKDGILNAPKGTAIIGRILYVADIDEVIGFDLDSRERVFALDMSKEATLVNDIAIVNSNTLLVTDSFHNQVFSIDIKDKSYKLFARDVPITNGITYHSKTNTAYLVSMGANINGQGKLWQTTFKSGIQKFEAVENSPSGVFDGVEMLDDSHLLISDWTGIKAQQGRFLVYDLVNKKSIVASYHCQSPADFYVDKQIGKLFIPATWLNEVQVLDLQILSTRANPQSNNTNKLYQFGFADYLLSGNYNGIVPVGDIKEKGTFGIGAPHRIDGEITFEDGKAFLTNSKGETIEVRDTTKIAFGVVAPFKKDFEIELSQQEKEKIFNTLDDVVNDNNGIYAIRITGTFTKIKTRSFPAVMDDPAPNTASILDRQKFFEFENIKGSLIGFRLPSYLEGMNIAGYHFHFLSEDKTKGGHVVDFAAGNVVVEVDILDGFKVDLPQTKDFRDFEFDDDMVAEIKKVEKGSGE
jgi:alpha-acetolactate decarboxylase